MYPLNTNKKEYQKKTTFLRVCDLLFHDHLGSVEEITGYYGNLPKDAVETLLRAIPRDIVEAATYPPPLTPGLQVGFIKEGSSLNHVFLIENHRDPHSDHP